MKVFQMKGESAEEALNRLADDLGIEKQSLRCIKESNNEFSFEAAICPAILDIEISPDKLKARIRRLQMPVGEDAPKLTTDFVLQQLKKKGIVYGVKTEEITSELFKILSDKNFRDTKPLNIVVAEGHKPIAAQVGRPQWTLDLKLFEKANGVYANKGEVVAAAPLAVQGREGMTVTGEAIPFEFEEQFKLPTTAGILVRRSNNRTEYYTESFGQLFLDEGTRLRLELDVQDVDDGMKAVLSLGSSISFTGKSLSPDGILEAAKASGVVRGLLKPQEVDRQLKLQKKWPAKIVLARGKAPVDGQAGQVTYPFKTPASQKPIDVDRAKESIVFPGETIALIEAPSAPEEGYTVFGESLRGRPYGEQPIYPGKNVSRERDGESSALKATAYGRVKRESDRVHVENILQVQADAMAATLDVFPQQALSFKDLQQLLRDKDVLVGFDQVDLERKLDLVFRAQTRERRLLVATGQAVTPGKNAKLRYYFKPSDMKSKGLLIKTEGKKFFAAPGDLLMIKFLPVEATEGYNLYRERIPVPKDQQAVDVEITAGDTISEMQHGNEGKLDDPLRLEYRAEAFGVVSWRARHLALDSVIRVSNSEDSVRLSLPSRSDFGTPITFEMVKKFADEESIRVELDREAIERSIRAPRVDPTELIDVEIARAIPAKNGENSRVDYFVKVNGEDVQAYLTGKSPMPETIQQADCVRPHEVIALKAPAGMGEDGRSVFGRRIVAERGLDEPWLIGRGIDRSKDGNSLIVSTPHPAFVLIEDGRLVAKNTIEIAPDKMSAQMTIYPSNNPRFQPREERVMSMIQAAGIQAGIQLESIREAIQTCSATQEPQTFEVAKGDAPQMGEEASHRLSVEFETTGVQLREDGSVDYKAGGIFQQVKAGQILMTKMPPTRGKDGYTVFDERIPGIMGRNHEIAAAEGVRVSEDGLEYFAMKDGILEFTGRRIQVIEGILVPGNVDYSTGNVDADEAKVIIRGSVLPGFKVSSRSEVKIERIAEACEIESGGSVSILGGFIGKDKGLLRSKGQVECFYINSGATVEADGDVVSRNEILGSRIRSGGVVRCIGGAGTISGGEIWAQKGLEAKVLGAQGSESGTHIHLGVNYMAYQAALARIVDEGLLEKEKGLNSEIKKLDEELRELYDQIPEASKKGPEQASKLQEQYKDLYDIRRDFQDQLETVEKQKAVIMQHVEVSKDFKIIVQDMLHPGTVFHHQGVDWVIKEPLRSVEISWSESSKNFVTRRI